MNNKFGFLFVIQMPCHCQQCGTWILYWRSSGGAGELEVSLLTWLIVACLSSGCLHCSCSFWDLGHCLGGCKGVAERGSRTLAGRGGGPPEGRKKNSDLIYFCRKLGCGTLNASAVAVNVLRSLDTRSFEHL